MLNMFAEETNILYLLRSKYYVRNLNIIYTAPKFLKIPINQNLINLVYFLE